MSDANETQKDKNCPLVNSGAYNPPKINCCPSCGGEIEDTDTPTMYRCVNSGETFYIEV